MERTLRDELMLMAPHNAEMFLPPTWMFPEPEPQEPVGYHYHSRGGSAPITPEKDAEYRAYRVAHDLWEHSRTVARTVAAKWAYADAMLAGRGTP